LAHQRHSAIRGKIVGIQQQARLAVDAKLQVEGRLILQPIVLGEVVALTDFVDNLVFGEIP
jgi:hypothetical protein